MFARSHGPAADDRSTIGLLFGLLCLITAQPGLANPPASLLSGPADAVIGQPVRTVLAADADQTVVQITFPVAVAPQDWRAVRKVAWAEIPTEYHDRHTGTIEAIEAAYGFHVAVAGRTAPDWRVAAVQWYREPADPTAPVAMVTAPSIHRGVPLATATVYPEAGQGILAGLILEIRHPAPSGLKQARDWSPAGRRAAAEPLPGSVVNPEHHRQLRAWSTDQPQQAAKRDLPDFFALTGNWVKLEVTATGIHRLSGLDLELLGLNLASVDPAKLRLYKGGGLVLDDNPEVADGDQADRVGLTEIPIRLEGVGDGEFNTNDRILFYGFGTDVWLDRLDPTADRLEFHEHLMQARGLYWLTWENLVTDSPLPGDPLRVAAVAAAPTGGEVLTTHRARYHGEQNFVYLPGFLRDRWAWQSLINAGFSPQANLSGVVPGAEATWQVDLCGTSLNVFNHSNEIRTSIHFNDDQSGAVIGTWRQSEQLGQERVRITGTTSALREGTNTLRLVYQNFSQAQVYLAFDSFDVLYEANLVKSAYPGALTSVFWGDEVPAPGTPNDVRYTVPAGTSVQVWDVSDPTAVVELTGSLSGGTTLTVGLVREPEVDRHLVLFAAGDTQPVVRASLAEVRPLRQTVPAADYLVIHPAAFGEAAERLADLRSRTLPGVDSPVAHAVSVEDIYANFSGGQKDWRAIRQFLRWHWLEHDRRVRWVCLLGDASRDYRNYQGRNPAVELVDWIPTEVVTNFPDSFPYILTLNHPYATDESLVAFDAIPPPPAIQYDMPDLAVGRLPANSASGALDLVERIRAYAEETPEGSWRNRVTFCADDLVGGNSDSEIAHTLQAEVLAGNYIPLSVDMEKVYLVDYPLVGQYKPAARRDLLSRLDAGTTIFYYVGHGAANVLADEQVFLSEFIPGLTNGGRRFVFLAFSCDVGVFDDPSAQAMAEQFLQSNQGGGIASIAASWVSIISHNNALSNASFANLYPGQRVDPEANLGEALRLGKIQVWTTPTRALNARRYNVTGDPALHLVNPVDDLDFAVGTTDSLRTGGLHTVNIDLAERALMAGQSYQLLVQESALAVPYYPNYTWLREGNAVFRGTGSLSDGQAQIPFLAPLSLRTGETGRLRCIISDGAESRVAALQLPVVQSAADGGSDVSGPDIRLAFPGGRLRVQQGAELTATLHDTSGVNILASNPANSVLLEFDGSGIYNNVSDAVAFAPGSYTRATLTTSLPPDLDLGQHEVVMTASDMFGNVGSDTLRFTLEAAGVGGLRDATVFPNPTPGPCRLVCDLATPMDLRWDIYTVSGRRVRSVQGSFGSAGPAILEWDGRDGEGDQIANGVYLFVLRGTMAGAGHEFRETGQLVIMR